MALSILEVHHDTCLSPVVSRERERDLDILEPLSSQYGSLYALCCHHPITVLTERVNIYTMHAIIKFVIHILMYQTL